MRPPLPPNDFDGLNFTDEQKAEIDKIHRETESYKSIVAKDDKLTPDQKDAMLYGYTRLEIGRTFKVLTPEQQKEVRKRILARRAADQSAPQKQPQRH
jgi:Spy/CpxP family protein refolding chaperone